MKNSRSAWGQTPNARLVYRQLDPRPDLAYALANSVNALSELERVVMEESRYQWANPEVFLYFFRSPCAADFDHTPIWVAREVIGPPNEDPLERFSLHDLCAGEVYEKEIGNGPFQLDGLPQLKDLYHAAHKEMNSERPVRTAQTWRLRLENMRKSSRAQIQLFPE